MCYCGFMLRVYCAGPRDVSSWSGMASGPQKRVDWFACAVYLCGGGEAQQHIEAIYSGREYIAALGPAFSWLAPVIKARLSWLPSTRAFPPTHAVKNSDLKASDLNSDLNSDLKAKNGKSLSCRHSLRP